MKEILIFSGTTEGRTLAEQLSGSGIRAVVCVATDYGTLVMPELEGIEVHKGRMDEEQMVEFINRYGFSVIVDATHPYAVIVSENIKKSAQKCGVPYIRLQRDLTKIDKGVEERYCENVEDCAEALKHTQGNILLTTGTKELSAFCVDEGLRERIYARVLPGEESIRICEKCGICGKHIIAMQGPFSEELNVALIRQFDIKYLVTKQSGRTGGVPQKLAAAKVAGAGVFIIGEPVEAEGLEFFDVVKKLEKFTGVQIGKTPIIDVALVGTGMGSREMCTYGVLETLHKADMIFGAPRLLKSIESWKTMGENTQTFPFYLGKDIIPILKEYTDRKRSDLKVVVLFSGDSGFYSGCEKLKTMLEETFSEEEMCIKVYPGISSVSYLAAAVGTSWQDAKIMSIHGRGERVNWESGFLEQVRYNEKSFFIVSGVSNICDTAKILMKYGLDRCRITVGYRLSYPDESIRELSAAECMEISDEGLYTLMIQNSDPEKRYLAPKYKDEEFIRGKVPMSKEEVRSAVISRMYLTDDSIVYDIGSGTGSIAVETAQRSGRIKVMAVERKKEGIELIRQNADKFKLPNIVAIEGEAPECLENLLTPTHAFIGGSNGKLKEILDVLYKKNPEMRIVITSVSMETTAELMQCIKQYSHTDEEIIQIQVNRSRTAGRYHLMQAENPIYICSFNFTL